MRGFGGRVQLCNCRCWRAPAQVGLPPPAAVGVASSLSPPPPLQEGVLMRVLLHFGWVACAYCRLERKGRVGVGVSRPSLAPNSAIVGAGVRPHRR
jgi:hypothetical protein